MNQTNRNNVKQKAEGKKCSLNLTVCPFLNIGKSLLQKLQKFKFNALCLANCLPKPTSSILILRNKEEGDSKKSSPPANGSVPLQFTQYSTTKGRITSGDLVLTNTNVLRLT